MTAVRSRLSRWKRVFASAYTSWNRHRSHSESAALAFYTLFSLAPVLVVAIAIAGTLFGADAVRGQVVSQFENLMGKEQAELIRRILQRSTLDHGGTLAAAFGVATLLIGSSALFVQLQSSLNRVWEVAPERGHFLRSLLHKRLVSFALLLGISFVLLVSLILSAGLDAFYEYLSQRFDVWPAVILGGNLLAALVLFTLLFALIFRILPDREIAWRDVWLGSVASAAAFQLGKWLFSLYIGRTAIASPYGSAGALVVIVLWVYYATTILLLGAEFTRAYSREMRGSRPERTPGTKAARVAAREVGMKRA